MKKKLILITLLFCTFFLIPELFGSSGTFVREIENRSIISKPVKGTEQTDSAVKSNYFDLGSSYNSNYNLDGQYSNITSQPNWTASAVLTLKSGFEASVNYLYIQNSDSTFTKPSSNVNLELGYSIDLLTYFNLYLGVNHIIQPRNTSSLTRGYDNAVMADLTYDFRWVNGSLSSAYMLGSRTSGNAITNSLSLSLCNNLSIDIDDFLGDNNILSFQPGFSLGISDENLYNDYLLSSLTAHPRLLIAKLIKRRPKLTAAEAITILKAKTVKTHKLQASSFGVNLPIEYSFRDFTLTFTTSAYKPLNQPSELVDTSWKFIFDLGIVYSLEW